MALKDELIIRDGEDAAVWAYVVHHENNKTGLSDNQDFENSAKAATWALVIKIKVEESSH